MVLPELLHQLHSILHSIPFLESHGYRPPIIDATRDSSSDNSNSALNMNGDHRIIGLRIFKDAVSREVDVLEQFLSRSDHSSKLSTNAPYFISVWNEILAAPPPIVAIGKIFDPTDGNNKKTNQKNKNPYVTKAGSIKVDVVADEGRKWIRVNTIRNSRMLAELREIDSLTDSEDEFDGHNENKDNDHHSERYGAPIADNNDNSLLRMGRALAAARTVPIAGTNKRPSVTLRLTRLQPEASETDKETAIDPRISQTIESLKRMGLDVQLGERAFRSLYHAQEGRTEGAPESISSGPSLSEAVQLRPTRRVNMDLSVLIALVSDLSHAPLPGSEQGAWARFRMPVHAWKLGVNGGGSGSTEEGTSANCRRSASILASMGEDSEFEYSKHSRALSMQCIQEMERGVVDEIVGRLRLRESDGGDASSSGDFHSRSKRDGDGGDVEFWTTEEVRDRCLQIVEKIGGEGERRRVLAMFPEHTDSPLTESDIVQCREVFWSGSRYPPSYFPSFLPIHIHPACQRIVLSASVSSFLTPSDRSPSRSVTTPASGPSSNSPSLFWAHLVQTCRHILSYNAETQPYSRSHHLSQGMVHPLNKDGESMPSSRPTKFKDGEMHRAPVTTLNPKLTVHTVESMLIGALGGMTTLTANRASVRAVVREMGRMREWGIEGVVGLEKGDESHCGEDGMVLDETGRRKWVGDQRDTRVSGEVGVNAADAAIWIVEPRSLAEGVRMDRVTM